MLRIGLRRWVWPRRVAGQGSMRECEGRGQGRGVPGGPAKAACRWAAGFRCAGGRGGRGWGGGPTADLNRSLELEQHGLAHEDLSRFVAQRLDLRLGKVDLFARAAPPHLQEPLDDRVHIEIAHRARPLLETLQTLSLASAHSLARSSRQLPSALLPNNPAASCCPKLRGLSVVPRSCRASTPSKWRLNFSSEKLKLCFNSF